MSICKDADDVWLNTMCRLNDYDVVKTNYYSVALPILISKNRRLTTVNVENNGNDLQLSNVSDYCGKMFNKNPFLENS